MNILMMLVHNEKTSHENPEMRKILPMMKGISFRNGQTPLIIKLAFCQMFTMVTVTVMVTMNPY